MADLKTLFDLEKLVDVAMGDRVRDTERRVNELAREAMKTAADGIRALREMPERASDLVTHADVAVVHEVEIRPVDALFAPSNGGGLGSVEVLPFFTIMPTGERFGMGFHHDGPQPSPRVKPGKYRAMFFMVRIED